MNPILQVCELESGVWSGVGKTGMQQSLFLLFWYHEEIFSLLGILFKNQVKQKQNPFHVCMVIFIIMLIEEIKVKLPMS